MGLLDLISGSKRKAGEVRSGGSEPGEDVTLMDNFIRIPSIGFFGQFRESPSGEWIVGWSDSNPEGSVGGHRQSGHGKYILYNSVDKKRFCKETWRGQIPLT